MPGAKVTAVAHQVFAQQGAELGAGLDGVPARAKALVDRAREVGVVAAPLVVRPDVEVEREAAAQRRDAPQAAEPARELVALVDLVGVPEWIRAVLRPHRRVLGARIVRQPRAVDVLHGDVGQRLPHDADRAVAVDGGAPHHVVERTVHGHVARDPEGVRDVAIDVDAQATALELRAANHAALIEQVPRDRIAPPGVAAGEAERDVAHERVAEDLRLPVSAGAHHLADRVRSQRARASAVGILRRRPVRVEERRVDVGREVVGVQHRDLADHGRVALGVAQRVPPPAGAVSVLRGDEDDAVRAAAAVDRRRRGILEDVDGLDVFGRDRGQRVGLGQRGQVLLAHGAEPAFGDPGVHPRHAVDDVERLCAAGVHRVHAADLDADAGAGRGVTLGDLHAGHSAL